MPQALLLYTRMVLCPGGLQHIRLGGKRLLEEAAAMIGAHASLPAAVQTHIVCPQLLADQAGCFASAAAAAAAAVACTARTQCHICRCAAEHVWVPWGAS